MTRIWIHLILRTYLMLKNLEICDLLLMRIKSWQITPIWRDQISQFFPEIPKLPRWWEFPNFSRYKFADENDKHLGKLFKIRFLKIIFSDNIYTSFRYLYMVFEKKTWIKKLRSSQVRMLNFLKLADKQWLNRKEKKDWF